MYSYSYSPAQYRNRKWEQAKIEKQDREADAVEMKRPTEGTDVQQRASQCGDCTGWRGGGEARRGVCGAAVLVLNFQQPLDRWMAMVEAYECQKSGGGRQGIASLGDLTV
ncbi:hypothetical protein JCM24511_06672 [Saitozyma sp. JCM 24511]|nr:hypothetical protein JCM24511_06672 [Saitozyma sp. JCM 24511]